MSLWLQKNIFLCQWRVCVSYEWQKRKADSWQRFGRSQWEHLRKRNLCPTMEGHVDYGPKMARTQFHGSYLRGSFDCLGWGKRFSSKTHMAHENNTSKCSGEENCPQSEGEHLESKQSGLSLRGMVNPACWENRPVKPLVITGCPWWIHDMLIESENIFQIRKFVLVFSAVYVIKLQFGFYFK